MTNHPPTARGVFRWILKQPLYIAMIAVIFFVCFRIMFRAHPPIEQHIIDFSETLMLCKTFAQTLADELTLINDRASFETGDIGQYENRETPTDSYGTALRIFASPGLLIIASAGPDRRFQLPEVQKMNDPNYDKSDNTGDIWVEVRQVVNTIEVVVLNF